MARSWARVGWAVAYAVLSLLELLVGWTKDAAEERLKGEPKKPPEDGDDDA